MLSDYEIKQTLFSFHSTIYITKHIHTNQEYILKRIPKTLTHKDERELSVLLQLDHPNIVKLFDHFEDERYRYLVLEYMKTGDIQSRLEKHGKFSEKDAKPIIKSLLKAVEYIHSKKIIHVDIKPDNILMISETDVKLCDFEHASYFEETDKRIGGTDYFLAPEILISRTYDYNIDLWTIGITVYGMLSGMYPFFQTKHKTLKQAICLSNPIFPSYLSDDAKDFISCFLKKNPDERISIKNAFLHKWLNCEE